MPQCIRVLPPLLACLLAGTSVLAQSTAPATMPAATAPVEPGSPKAVALGFVQALVRGDAAAAKGLCTFSEDPAQRQREQQVLDATAKMMSGFRQLNEAAAAKFGEAATRELAAASPPVQAQKEIEGAQANVNDDVATIGHGQDANPLQLLKVDGAWRVNMDKLSSHAKDLARVTDFMSAMGTAAGETAEEVRADHYGDVREIRRAMDVKLRAYLANTTTRPATMASPTAPAATNP